MSSSRKRIGIDCDGVLAEFYRRYTEEMQRLFPHIPNLVGTSKHMPCWFVDEWPGATKEMVKATWDAVTNSRDWWLGLAPIPTFDERRALTHLARDHEVYIITARRETKGNSVLHQTWRWLGNHGIHGVSVIVQKNKGPLARALKLDYFLDDRPQNCEEVNNYATSCRVFLREWPWNENTPMNWDIGGVKSITEFIDIIEGR